MSGLIICRERPEIDLQKTGKQIKMLCKKSGLSVKDIQRELYIGSFQSVYAWFQGKSLPSVDNLFRLSRLLHVTIDELLVPVMEEQWIDIFSFELNDKRTKKRYSSDRRMLTYNSLVAK